MNRKFVLNIFLAILLAVLLYIGNVLFFLFSWIALVPACLLAHRNSCKQIILPAFVASILIAAPSMFYVSDFDLLYFFYAILYAGSFAFFCLLLICLGYKFIKYPFSILVLPGVWMFLLFVYSFAPWGIYFFNFGSLHPMLFPINYIITSYGITFLITLFSSTLASYLVYKRKILLYFLFFLSLILFFSYIYSLYALPTGKIVKVAIIQGNFPQDWEWRTNRADTDVLDIYKRLTLEAAKSKPDLIIWPEYAIPKDILLHKDLYAKISNLALEVNANLIFGSLVNAERSDPQKNYEWDTAFVFSRKGEMIGRYDSVIPFPYKNWVIKGSALPIIETDIGKFGIAMCYEENFGNIFRKYRKSGAQFFITLANDKPINNQKIMAGKSMHARTRAAENGLYLLRATNTGLSQVVNPYGKVVSELDFDKEGFILADIFIK